MKFDLTAFLNGYSKAYGNVDPKAAAGLEQLLSSMELDPDLADRRWIAYMLATVKHECANKFQPITEVGARSYFDKYEPGTSLGKSLGNTQAGDGYLFRGRGYVQITGRTNYQTMTARLTLTGGDDLILHPDQALQPGIAYRIMSFGMRRGSFTGKKLADYIDAAGANYQQARRIINGLDRADLIAGYATTFESILRSSETA